MLDETLRAAVVAQLDGGASPAAVVEWLELMAPHLGWDEATIEAFQAGRGAEATRARAAGAVAQADFDEGLQLLRGQMIDLARLFEVQKAEILTAKCATAEKMVKAHVQTAEQFRRHLETLRESLPEDPTKRQATVGDLFAAAFAAVHPGAVPVAPSAGSTQPDPAEASAAAPVKTVD